jgi:hypothetical protein
MAGFAGKWNDEASELDFLYDLPPLLSSAHYIYCHVDDAPHSGVQDA